MGTCTVSPPLLVVPKGNKSYCVAVVPNCVLKLNFGFVFALSV